MQKVYELTNDDKNFLNSREECLCYCFTDKKFFVGSEFNDNDNSIICDGITWIDAGFYKPLYKNDLVTRYLRIEAELLKSMVLGELTINKIDDFTELKSLVEVYIHVE